MFKYITRFTELVLVKYSPSINRLKRDFEIRLVKTYITPEELKEVYVAVRKDAPTLTVVIPVIDGGLYCYAAGELSDCGIGDTKEQAWLNLNQRMGYS